MFITSNSRTKTIKISKSYAFSIVSWSRSNLLTNNGRKKTPKQATLAIEHYKDQIHRTFPPAIIQPSNLLLSFRITSILIPKASKALVCITLMAFLFSHQVMIAMFLSLLTPTIRFIHDGGTKSRPKSFQLLPSEMPLYVMVM